MINYLFHLKESVTFFSFSFYFKLQTTQNYLRNIFHNEIIFQRDFPARMC